LKSNETRNKRPVIIVDPQMYLTFIAPTGQIVRLQVGYLQRKYRSRHPPEALNITAKSRRKI